jgi:Pentapeptide repeats (9 copies)
MSPRASSRAIGATRSPDLEIGEAESEQLPTIEIDRLETRFVLEDMCVRAGSLTEIDAGSGRLASVKLDGVDLSGSKLRAVELSNVLLQGIDAANGDWGGGEIRRTRFERARLTGLGLVESHTEEVCFSACKLEYANFRHSRIERTTFEDCVLTGADFHGASITASRFSRCRLEQVDFTGAELERVDIRGSELALVGSAQSLRGAIIDSLQLLELAPALAAELAIAVEDP